MDDFIKTLITAGVSLFSGIVGGIMVLAGQYVHDRRIREDDKRKKKADKLEELVSAIYEHQHWLTTQYRQVALGNYDKQVVTPFHKIRAITQTYFPEFAELVAKLAAAGAAYENLLVHNIEHAGEIRLPQPLYERVQALHSQYLSCCSSLLAALEKYSEKHIH